MAYKKIYAIHIIATFTNKNIYNYSPASLQVFNFAAI